MKKKMKGLTKEELLRMQLKWNKLQELYGDVSTAKAKARQALLEYIVDSSIPVSNRWDVFLESPAGTLKKESSAPKDLTFWAEIKPTINENYYRYQTVYWSGLEEEYADENTGECLLTDDQKLEIMSRCCESFLLDW